jgi:glycosyltransferase involved in cell wall biosynthesis
VSYRTDAETAVLYLDAALGLPIPFEKLPLSGPRRLPAFFHAWELHLVPSTRLAFIGNSLPRQCGIATFTTDLQQAVARSRAHVETAIVAMTDHGRTYNYPGIVRLQINDERIEEYERAADFLNAGHFQAVSLQHEFGIFGGEAGNHVMALLSRLAMPIVTTLHTVLAEPRPVQRSVLNKVIDVSSKVIVMAEKARSLLRTVYQVPADKIEIVPHGIPDTAFLEPDAAKAALGFAGKAIILTFGLLSPNKGIEVMIDAMPSILKRRPDSIYVVLGATHPNLVRQEGESYREKLVARAHELGVQDQVVFLNRFVDQATLLKFISMCDVYVTPYLNEAQMTSGTLAYSFGLGKAVVSTPYWHAQELLAEGRGVFVPFGDANAIGVEIAGLLTDDARRLAMRMHAYSSSRSMTWERTAERYLDVFDSARRAHPPKVLARRIESIHPAESVSAPPMQLSHFLSMCDDTGLLQHAICSVPDRLHGYCIDDNARALLVACALNAPGEQRLPETLTSRFAAFVQHAWNPDHKRFRNFMSFDRRWLEDFGSEDSHGRTLWALGECVRSDANESRRQWAASLFAQALAVTEHFSSPRAWAFTLLGLDAYCVTLPENAYARELRHLLADRLMVLISSVETKEWVWFEEGLAYDNARLPQALIVTGTTISAPGYIAAGLRSLRWLMTLQTSRESGVFRPIGSEGFGGKRAAPSAFDQQPLEATAAVSACLAAWRADGDVKWKQDAALAFSWFLGTNDLSTPLVDVETGSCRDGLHPERANENRGGESVVSYLLSLAEIRQVARMFGNRTKPAPVLALSA